MVVAPDDFGAVRTTESVSSSSEHYQQDYLARDRLHALLSTTGLSIQKQRAVISDLASCEIVSTDDVQQSTMVALQQCGQFHGFAS